MIEGRLIVCIGSSWDYDPTSKHHVMKRLARRNTVLWVNYHASRKPGRTRGDLGHALRVLRKVGRGLIPVSPTLHQLTPLVIPGASRPSLSRLHERLVIAQIRRAVARLDPARRKPIQVWTFAPDVPFLAGALDEECFIYYCVDEFTLFDGFDARRIADLERRQLARADLVITSAETLYENRRTRHPNVVLVRHGVEFDHFAAAWRKRLPPPQDLAEIPRPLFGYVGLIHHWVDVELLAETARKRPYYSFVLIGDVRTDVTPLRDLDNVFLLGRRPYADLPAYCSAFAAGLMLFRQNELSRHVNPIKMAEYLAAGLPVISTPLPEAARFPGPIRFAASPRAFARACDAVLTARETLDRAAIARCVADQDWNAKVEHISQLVQSAARNASPVRSKPVREVLPIREHMAPASRRRPEAITDEHDRDRPDKAATVTTEPRP